MYRPVRNSLLALCLAVSTATAQEGADARAVERYLADLGLDRLLADHLGRELESAVGEERLRTAEALGDVLTDLLEQETDRDRRVELERRARELIQAMPDASTGPLRLTLASTGYTAAARLAERHRLAQATPAEREEASRLLQGVIPEFQRIATDAHRRVMTFERIEDRVYELTPEAEERLSSARRTRSLAMFNLGWSRYQLASVTGEHAPAARALEDFGWLLNSPDGQRASIDRVNPRNFRFDHVAEAAIGVALCESEIGEHIRALRWLDELESSSEISNRIRESLPIRRAVIYAQSARWNELRFLVEEWTAERLGVPRPGPAEARMLAVLSLRALESDPGDLVIGATASMAMGELIRLGEAPHVLDLLDRFGSAPLPGDGFVVRYVRALRAFGNAADAHPGPEPAEDDRAITLYTDAARSFRGALAAPDSDAFPDEHGACVVRLGVSLFIAGRSAEAAETLSSIPDDTPLAELERGLWFAHTAATRASERALEEGRTIDARRLAEMSLRARASYVLRFPSSANAVRLLLQDDARELASRGRAVELLLGIPDDNPAANAARAHAATLLLEAFRAAPESARTAAGLRFADVSERVAADDAAGGRAELAVIRWRQVLDVLLGLDAPDPARAQSVLEELRATAAFHGLDLSDIAAELAYRELQIALTRDDAAAASRALQRLSQAGGPYEEAGRRKLYRVALERFAASEGEPESRAETAARLIGIGDELLEHLDPEDPALPGVRDAVASAAAALAEISQDPAATARAIELDTEAMRSGTATRDQLRRLAGFALRHDRADLAEEAWRTILAGSEPGSESWTEARFRSLELLAARDRRAAAASLRQYFVLNDGPGGPPWGPSFLELAQALGVDPEGP